MTVAERKSLILDKATEKIAVLEGFKSAVYKCSAKKSTIGYGFTDADLVRKGTITKAEANRILRKKCSEILNMIMCEITVPLTIGQTAALVSFTYNAGDSAFKRSTLKKFINAKASEKAIENEFFRWVYVTKEVNGKHVKVKSQGLINRRNIEVLLWKSK